MHSLCHSFQPLFAAVYFWIAEFLDSSCFFLKPELKFDFANFLIFVLILIPWTLYTNFFCCKYLNCFSIAWIIPYFLWFIPDKSSSWFSFFPKGLYVPRYCFPKRVRLGRCPEDLCKRKRPLLSHPVSGTLHTRERFAHESLQLSLFALAAISSNWT